MKVIKQNVGIDVSKKELAVCLTFLRENLSVKIKGTKKFSNNEFGFKAMMEWLERKKMLPCLYISQWNLQVYTMKDCHIF